MDNVTFKRALMLRLGIPFQDRPSRCQCTNHPVIDEHVDHILNCKKFNGVIKSRHDALTAELRSLCKSATIHFSDPVLGELRTPDNDDMKAADGCLRGFIENPLFIDVTIANPTGSTYLKKGSSNHKHLATTILPVKKRKMRNTKRDAVKLTVNSCH